MSPSQLWHFPHDSNSAYIVTGILVANPRPARTGNAHRIQLTTYAELTGCGQAKIVTITKAATPKVVVQTFPILANDGEHARQLFPVGKDAMGQGFAIPNRTNTFCVRKYRSFWRQCQQEYGGAAAG